MKYCPAIVLIIIIFFIGCVSTKIVNIKQIKHLNNDASQWNLNQCNQVINYFTVDNTGGDLFKAGLVGQKVFIRALLLNQLSIEAIARKEVIEKRLDTKDYYNILDQYLNIYLNQRYDKSSDKIIDLDTNFSKGYSFRVYFENISDPFEPILLEEGYSYFFLENLEGEFSRVTEVSGLFVEDYFQLDGYLNAIITFSHFSVNGKRLFESKNLNESYRLVFNGLQQDPVILQWNINL
jgi:hypothetical protein